MDKAVASDTHPPVRRGRGGNGFQLYDSLTFESVTDAIVIDESDSGEDTSFDGTMRVVFVMDNADNGSAI